MKKHNKGALEVGVYPKTTSSYECLEVLITVIILSPYIGLKRFLLVQQQHNRWWTKSTILCPNMFSKVMQKLI